MPRDRQSEPRKTRPSLVARSFMFLINIIFWLIVSLLISIGIEWVGIFTWWKAEGLNHSIQMFSDELSYANHSIANSFISDDPRSILASTMHWLDGHGETVMGFLRQTLGGTFDASPEAHFSTIEILVLSAIFIVKIFCLRFLTILFALPIFVLLFWHALVDGLVERDLRKAGGARESNVIFDFASRWSVWIIVLGAILYLASPITIHPLVTMLPAAVFFFLFTRTSFASYKKHI